jgi:hypothetical protein
MVGPHSSDPAALPDRAQDGVRWSARDAAVLTTAVVLAAAASWCSVDATVVIVTVVSHFFAVIVSFRHGC